FVGLDWDQNQHLHPDERFLTMVETSIAPVNSLAQYFDTENSSLNPHNRGYGFYVYGTLPIFMVRYAGEWLDKTGYDEIHLVGRQLSAIMDLGTVVVVYLIATRLYRNRRLSLLAAAFASFSVLPIQLSHYFTVDTFTNFFGMLAFYFAVLVLPSRAEMGQGAEPAKVAPGDEEEAAGEAAGGAVVVEAADRDIAALEDSLTGWLKQEWKSVIPYALFGAALGMAMACKINAVLLAALLPGAVLVRFISQPREERDRWVFIYLRNLFIAAVVSVIFFRIFQPYAFSGPGFFGIIPNDRWMQNLRDLAAQSTGDVDFPPALQWARRPITFALQNMIIWGLGLPLGILAWAAFLWMGVRIFRSIRDPRGEWNQHLLLWGWTGVYFAYQSYNWTRSMRYQMLVYPTLAIIAAWAVFALWESQHDRRWKSARVPWLRVGAALVGVSVLALTFAWAFAFTRIYTRPVTRVAASRWIYQNVPGPVNLKIDTQNGQATQPVAFRSGYTLESEAAPLVLAFRPRQPGQLVSISFEHLGSLETDAGYKTLSLFIGQSPDDPNPLAMTTLSDEFIPDGDPRGKSYTAYFELPVPLEAGKTYYLSLSLPGSLRGVNLAGPLAAQILTEHGPISQSLPEPVDALRVGKLYRITFQPLKSGLLRQVVLDRVVDWEGRPETKTLRVSIADTIGNRMLASGEVESAFGALGDIRGESYTISFSQPVELEADHTYSVLIEQVDGPGALAIYGSKQANESSWDDALPVGLDGYNPYDYNYGVYRSDLNFEMYWDDNADKLNRFLSVLDQADYIFISSNRQWGTTTRVPERYPLTSEYYRQLLGCPAEREITWCYSVAQPGMFKGNLGYDLVAVFQSDPNLGSLRFNSQFAEEAFTVYDAPKVLIFKKTLAFDPDRVQQILGSVDLAKVRHITPRKATSYPADLMLPASRLAAQMAGGTWVELFRPDALTNRFPGLAAVIWYLAVALLGWVMYPFTRLALHGLPDRGYPFTRLVGLLGLAYLVWLLGSFTIPFTPLTITLVFAALLLANLGLAYSQRQALLKELRVRWKDILLVELL
ncbi:MAG: phospholipid carrier-dependent glycosyltransferase, partial [Chloroflexi bacterium]